MCALGLSEANAQTKKPPRAATKPVLYIGALASHQLSPQERPLYALVESALLDGARIGARQLNSKYADVTSYSRIVELQRKVDGTARRLERYAGADIIDKFQKERRRFHKAKGEAHYLSAQIHLLPDGKIRVDLELYAFQNGTRVDLLKRVGGCGEETETVLDRVQEAARQVVLPRSRSEAVPPINVLPGSVVTLGSMVTLRSCAEVLYDDDQLVYEWKLVGARVVPLSGDGGRRYRFRATELGRQRVRLCVRRVVGPGRACSEVEVHVTQKPRAHAGKNELRRPGSRIRLDSSRSLPVSAKRVWRLISAPTPPSGFPCTESTKRQCEFVASHAGRYEFELQVSNPLGQSLDRVTYLVADGPTASAVGSDQSATLGVEAVLDARSSSDTVDANPRYYWRIVSGPKGWQRHATLATPHSATPVFAAADAGLYEVELRVSARRDLGRVVMLDEGTTKHRIHVGVPGWTLFAGTEVVRASEPFPLPLFIAPTIGVSVRPLSMLARSGSSCLLSSWSCRVDLRATQSLARIDLDRDPTSKQEEIQSGGGATLGVGYLLGSPTRLSLTPHGDFYFRLDGDGATGFGANAEIGVALAGNLQLLWTPGYLRLFQNDANADLLRIGLALGWHE